MKAQLDSLLRKFLKDTAKYRLYIEREMVAMIVITVLTEHLHSFPLKMTILCDIFKVMRGSVI